MMYIFISILQNKIPFIDVLKASSSVTLHLHGLILWTLFALIIESALIPNLVIIICRIIKFVIILTLWVQLDMRTGVLLHERCKHLLVGLLTVYASTSTLELLIYNLYWLNALAIIDIWRNRRPNRVILLGLFSLCLVLFLVGDVVLEIRTLCMPIMVFIVLLCLLLSSHFVSWLLAGIVDRYWLVQGIVRFRIAGLVNASCVGVAHFLRSSLDRNQLLVSINDSCLMVW